MFLRRCGIWPHRLLKRWLMKASQKTIGTRLRAFSTHYGEARSAGLVLRLIGAAIGGIVLYAVFR